MHPATLLWDSLLWILKFNKMLLKKFLPKNKMGNKKKSERWPRQPVRISLLTGETHEKGLPKMYSFQYFLNLIPNGALMSFPKTKQGLRFSSPTRKPDW